MFLLAVSVFVIVSDITVLQLGVERGAVFVDVGQVAVSQDDGLGALLVARATALAWRRGVVVAAGVAAAAGVATAAALL